MSLLLLFLPTGTAAHTGSAGITLQDVTLTANGAFTIFGTLSVTLGDVTAVSTIYTPPKAIPYNAKLMKKMERDYEMKLSQKLQKQLIEEQMLNSAIRAVNTELADQLSETLSNTQKMRDMAKSALQKNIEILQEVSGPVAETPVYRTPVQSPFSSRAVPVFAPKMTPSEREAEKRKIAALQKAREAKVLKKQAEEERRRKQLENLEKARKAKKNAKK